MVDNENALENLRKAGSKFHDMGMEYWRARLEKVLEAAAKVMAKEIRSGYVRLRRLARRPIASYVAYLYSSPRVG